MSWRFTGKLAALSLEGWTVWLVVAFFLYLISFMLGFFLGLWALPEWALLGLLPLPFIPAYLSSARFILASGPREGAISDSRLLALSTLLSVSTVGIPVAIGIFWYDLDAQVKVWLHGIPRWILVYAAIVPSACWSLLWSLDVVRRQKPPDPPLHPPPGALES